MRILVENGCYDLRNMGDVAMLQVAVARLRALWPGALIEVVTDEPGLLARYCPAVQVVSAQGRGLWFTDRNVLYGPGQYLPESVNRVVRGMWCHVRRRLPVVAHRLIQLHAGYKGKDISEMNRFLEAVFAADLLVVSGGGDINDAFADYAQTLLDVMEMAGRRGAAVIMFGQGIGPITNPKLRARATAILGTVDLLAVREGLASPAVLDSLGVMNGQVFLTGDDAIEPAYKSRPRRLGENIGVNLRVANYSGTGNSHIEIIRSVLQNAGRKYNARLIPLPISFEKSSSDVETIGRLLRGCENDSDGCQNLDEPTRVIKNAGLCRVAVTGSYHSAVFALAQGVPVVGLANSDYYIDKFRGLAHQFGCGCEVLLLDDRGLRDKLAGSIANAWGSAEDVRPKLLAAAKRQIGLGQAIYRRVYELVEVVGTCGKTKG